ncbi:MAG: ATP-binding protein [Candidatus Omnitrophota bacterium]
MTAFKKTQSPGVRQRLEKISKKVGRAIADYRMIQNGDKILVGVSGGKDSLTLLEALWSRKAFVPIHYDVLAVHVDLGFSGPHLEPFEGFLKKEGFPFYVKRKAMADPREGKQNCFWCSWNRRRVLFEEARKHGCNKIALGHHKDDIVETVLMNLFFEGEISAMSPNQEMFKGKLSIIRPLAYVEEREIKDYVRLKPFPVIKCLCCHAAHTQRAVIKKMIETLEATAPGVKSNIFRSLQRIKKDYLL